MRLIAFTQWDKLASLLRGMARQSAADYAQRKIVRIIPKNGIAHLANYAPNLLAVEGGKTTIVMPDIVPGKARDLMLRVSASGENEIRIRVTSTWYNRLVYDAALPELERKTWTIRGPAPDAPFLPAGLMGPVLLQMR